MLVYFMLAGLFALPIFIYKATQDPKEKELPKVPFNLFEVLGTWGEFPKEQYPPAAAVKQSQTSAPDSRGLSEVRIEAAHLMDELHVLGTVVCDAQAVEDLGRIADTARLLAENARADEADVQPTLRFFDRYADSVLKLAHTYSSLEQAGGSTPAMRKSMQQIKAMLADFAAAFEKFRLSLFENNIMDAAVEMDVARSLLVKDGLSSGAGAVQFATLDILETMAEDETMTTQTQ